ncbi:hypothetical protein E2C01_031165 [Portunus trituberculatus]|uniref:Uncharacterized protein n=1 Tax=Portunus trituberculatus TaxID=210409 RepID=A0A5B7EZC3_PORTR|nr:hypothetical protein [Portunus trituberculatus]
MSRLASRPSILRKGEYSNALLGAAIFENGSLSALVVSQGRGRLGEAKVLLGAAAAEVDASLDKHVQVRISSMQ